MRKQLFNFCQTYSTVTPESAEIGDYEDTGFEIDRTSDYSLADIIRAIEDQGVEHLQVNCGEISAYGSFYTTDYQTGEEKQDCIHVSAKPRNIERLFKILNNKGLN